MIRYSCDRSVVRGSLPAAEFGDFFGIDPDLMECGIYPFLGEGGGNHDDMAFAGRSRSASKGRKSDGGGIGNDREATGGDGGGTGGVRGTLDTKRLVIAA